MNGKSNKNNGESKDKKDFDVEGAINERIDGSQNSNIGFPLFGEWMNLK